MRPRASTPGRNAAAISRWYEVHARRLPWREEPGPYQTLVSEFMLQQTTVETVIPYYHRFMERFPDFPSLAGAREEEVLGLWSGLGYYRRARNLLAAARAVQTEHGGRLPEEIGDLRSLPGIGPYTAAAVAAIAHGGPFVALDGNLKRVLARLAGIQGDPAGADVKRKIESAGLEIVRSGDPSILNQALMDLGAGVCLPRDPLCGECPLNAGCVARGRDEVSLIPPPRKRPRTVGVTLLAGLIKRNGRILMRKREGRLMAGMWELPMIEPPSDADGIDHLRAEVAGLCGWAPRVMVPEGKLTHTITRHRIQVHYFSGGGEPMPLGERVMERGTRYAALAGTDGPREAKWFLPGGLEDVPVTGLTRKILRRSGIGRRHAAGGAA